VTCNLSYRNFCHPIDGICLTCHSAEHVVIAVEEIARGPDHAATRMHLGGVARTVAIVGEAAFQDPPDADEPMTAPEVVMTDAETQVEDENLPAAHFLEADTAVNFPVNPRPREEPLFARRDGMIDTWASGGYGVDEDDGELSSMPANTLITGSWAPTKQLKRTYDCGACLTCTDCLARFAKVKFLFDSYTVLRNYVLIAKANLHTSPYRNQMVPPLDNLTEARRLRWHLRRELFCEEMRLHMGEVQDPEVWAMALAAGERDDSDTPSEQGGGFRPASPDPSNKADGGLRPADAKFQAKQDPQQAYNELRSALMKRFHHAGALDGVI